MRQTIILLALFLVVFSSCSKNDTRTSILGSWNCDEYSEIGQHKYQVNIVRNYYSPNDTNEYIINNFHNLGIAEEAEVFVQQNETGELIITRTSTLEISFSGSGIIAADFSRIEWDYTVNDGITNPHVIANYD